MARIAGVDLPRNKRVIIALTYIYGIGPTRAKQITEATGISLETRTFQLNDEQINRLREEIDRHRVEGDLRREIQLNVKRLMEIGTYRGIRHRRGLPVRGQRTRTNARTRRGVRKTVAGRGRK